MLASRRKAPAKAAAPLPTVGDVGKKGGSHFPKGKWAALADTDTDSDTDPVAVTVVAPPAAIAVAADFWTDPVFLAMDRGEIQWGDMLTAADPAAVALSLSRRPPPPPAPALLEEDDDEPLRSLWHNPRAPLRAKEEEIWEQPFSVNLEEYWSETYDTRAMSDSDYHALMGWLFSVGWYVDRYDRAGVRTWQDNAPALRWNPATMEAEEPHHHHHHHHRAPKPKGAVTIPRFCREGHACSATGGSCRYVHGDTIPRMDELCSFGAGCGASDPTGVKRSQCLRMHPGETWTAELVIRRI
jgi:hypothetical protein